MLTEETQKKLWLWGMIAILILGLFWLIFVFLFNRGSIRLEAEAPYRVEMIGGVSQNCTENPCIVQITPGDYTVRLIKDGYNDVSISVTVPMGGEVTEAVEFIFKPYLSLIGVESELDYFGESRTGLAESDIAKLDISGKIFSEENFVAYLARNAENGRQTLYYQELPSAESETAVDAEALGEAKVAASFIRDIEDYMIYPFIDEAQKIVLVDSSGDTSVLYLVDLREKTRDNILEHANIGAVKWIPDTESFLYEARDEGTIYNTLFVFDTETKLEQRLELAASLNNTVFIGPGRILAAVPETQFINFIEYDLIGGTSRLIMSDGTLGSIEKIQASPDGKAVFLLKEGNVYELRFAR